MFFSRKKSIDYEKNNILSILSGRSIYSKLFYIMLLSLIASCVFITIWTSIYVKNFVFNKNTKIYLDEVYNGIQRGINRDVDQISSFSVYIFDDGYIYEIIEDKSMEECEKEEKIKKYLNEYYSDIGLVANVDIAVRDDFVIRMKNDKIEMPDDDFKSRLRHTNIVLSDDLVKNGNAEQYFVFGRRIVDSFGKKLFDVYLYVPEEKIYENLSKLNNNGNLFFIIANNKVVSHQDKGLIGRYMLLPKELSFAQSGVHRSVEHLYDEHHLAFEIDAIGNWNIESCMSYKWLYSAMNMLRNTIIIVLIIIVIISLLLVIVIPKSLVNKMLILQQRMTEFSKKGEDNEIYKQIDFKEISELERSFEDMTAKIRNLIQRNLEEKEKQRKAELKALQAQINPHFLYNTLDAIVWYAKLNKQDELANMAYELATFFRMGLHKGDSMIRVSEEIKHVESYVVIEQFRFPNLFSLECKIQDDIMDELVPKIILQPIVENSIRHGFANISTGGEIKILGYKDANDDIIFVIEDNGCGIKSNSLIDRDSNGYGLYNVDQRIKLEFGEEYGLNIRRGAMSGTVVIIHLKKTTGLQKK